MARLSREQEIAMVLEAARPYLSVPTAELERLLDESLDDTESHGLPHRGTGDRSIWVKARAKFRKEIATQEPLATATLVFAAGQAVDWAHSVGFDVTDYNLPIAIVVALAVKAFWPEQKSTDVRDSGDDDQPDG